MDRRMYLSIIIGAFLVGAFFAAWRDQHQRVKDLEAQVAADKPEFVLAVNGATYGVTSQKLGMENALEQRKYLATDGAGELTMILLGVELINKGSPSVAIYWSARYVSATLNQEVGAASLLDKIDVNTFPGLPPLTIKAADTIDNKTATAIQRGGYVPGRLLIFISGDRRKELETGAAEVTVTTHDYLGKPYHATFKATNKLGMIPRYPGEK